MLDMPAEIGPNGKRRGKASWQSSSDDALGRLIFDRVVASNIVDVWGRCYANCARCCIDMAPWRRPASEP